MPLPAYAPAQFSHDISSSLPSWDKHALFVHADLDILSLICSKVHFLMM